MPEHYDFKKEWEKTRSQLAKISKEAVKVAKKGEKELVKFSRQSKLHMDATTLGLRREKLYYEIGKEYAHAKDPQAVSSKLAKLLTELRKTNKRQSALKRKIGSKKQKAQPASK